MEDSGSGSSSSPSLKRKRGFGDAEEDEDDIMKQINALCSQGTAKSRLEAQKIPTTPFYPICTSVELSDCIKKGNPQPCPKVHFQPIIRPYTDASLGHCSYLNTCFGEPSYKDSPTLAVTGGGGPTSGARAAKECRFTHFEIAKPLVEPTVEQKRKEGSNDQRYPPQWVTCDVRPGKFDLEILGKFNVIMADPPWDIHMSLPYGTMTDDEMRAMPIPQLQSEGLLFLWVTARAMELGRDLLSFWGYKRIDEIIWVKTNQLQRLIRSGRTGHWLNHTCEHLLIGLKSPPSPNTPDLPNTSWPSWLKRGLDVDVLVSEVRETSRKPDEIYDMIDRCCPTGRKVEIFGRKHNTRPGWLTIGNQIGGDQIYEPELAQRMKAKYPNRQNFADLSSQTQ